MPLNIRSRPESYDPWPGVSRTDPVCIRRVSEGPAGLSGFNQHGLDGGIRRLDEIDGRVDVLLWNTDQRGFPYDVECGDVIGIQNARGLGTVDAAPRPPPADVIC